MPTLYHGSSTSNLQELSPHPSTHGNYVYATPYKELAIIFSGRSGDDQVITLYRNEDTDPWQLVERVPLAFQTIFNNSASLYIVSDESFIDINSHFAELVSQESVSVLSEEKIPNTFDAIKELASTGKIKMYSYPDRPLDISMSDYDLINRELQYHIENNLPITKNTFNRTVLLHPNLMPKINKVLEEQQVSFQYQKEDLTSLFIFATLFQIAYPHREQYLNSIYISVTSLYPDLSPSFQEILAMPSQSKDRIVDFTIDFLKNNYASSINEEVLSSLKNDSRPINEIIKSILKTYKQQNNKTKK